MSNDMVKFGSVGAIFCMLSAIAEIVAVTMLWVSLIDYAFAGSHIDFGSGIAMAAGVALLSVGMFGFWKQHKNKFLLATGIFGMVAMAGGLAASIILWLNGGAVTSVSLIFQGFSFWNLLGIAGVVWLEITGVFLILLGVALYRLKEKTGVEKATRGAGILTLISGIIFCAIIPFGYLAGQMLFLMSTILTAYVMLKAR